MAKGLITREWDDVSGTITATFASGESVSFDITKLPADIYKDLAMHGAEQKIFDSIAGDQKKGATVAELTATLQGVYDNLAAGLWKGSRGSGGEGTSTTLAVEALARMLAARNGGEVDLADAKQRWELLPKEQRAAAVKAPAFAAEIAKVRAEKAAARAEAAPAGSEAMFGLLG